MTLLQDFLKGSFDMIASLIAIIVLTFLSRSEIYIEQLSESAY